MGSQRLGLDWVTSLSLFLGSKCEYYWGRQTKKCDTFWILCIQRKKGIVIKNSKWDATLDRMLIQGKPFWGIGIWNLQKTEKTRCAKTLAKNVSDKRSLGKNDTRTPEELRKTTQWLETQAQVTYIYILFLSTAGSHCKILNKNDDNLIHIKNKNSGI